MNPDKLQPAFFGGLFIGVLSALPIVNVGNCCCCLWVVAGGALAIYLRQQNTAYQVQASEGALLGLMAGAIGGVISAVLSIPLQMAMGDFQRQMMERVMSREQDVPPEMREMMERMMTGSAMRAASALFSIRIGSACVCRS